MKIGKYETGRFGVLGQGRLNTTKIWVCAPVERVNFWRFSRCRFWGSQIGPFWQTQEICTSGLSGGLQTREICTSSLSGGLQTREICTSGLSGGLQTREICTSSLSGGLQTREICTSGLSGGLQTRDICTSSLSGGLRTRGICASGFSGGLQTREICASSLSGGLQTQVKFLCFPGVPKMALGGPQTSVLDHLFGGSRGGGPKLVQKK